MEYVGFVFGVFGLLAFLSLSSLKRRVRSLEMQLSSLQGTDYAAEKASLLAAARGYIGKPVKLSFKEDEEDGDALLAAMKKGVCTLLDADEDWLLVHLEHNRVVKDKLIRLDSVKGITG
ncbi:MAG: hypothetical protein IK116_00770 [Firmicutes bacterium]|nr:hypothetical protein [Bacillota bacterium]